MLSVYKITNKDIFTQIKTNKQKTNKNKKKKEKRREE